VDATFTPDGSFLDYTVFTGQDQSGKVYQIPVLGGTPHLLIDKADTGVSFSPDGTQLTYALLDVQSSKLGVMTAKADGSGARKLAEYPGSVTSSGYIVRWSPDGRRIAAVDNSVADPNGMNVRLLEIDIATGHAKPIPSRHWREVMDATWLPDGSGLLLAALAKTGADPQLWIISYPAGIVRRISNDLSKYLSVAVSADGRTIASVQLNLTSSLWVGPANAPDRAQQVISGRLDGNGGTIFTPDNRLVYGGNHSQNWDLFLSDVNGNNTRQLVFDHNYHGSPALCDHGRSIVYDTDFDGTSHLWKLDLQTGASSKLTNGGGELIASCGRDSDWVFYWGQVAGETSHVFKVPVSGGSPIRVSDLGALGPGYVSPDGRHVVITATEKDGTIDVAVVSADNGAPEARVPSPPTLDRSVGSGCWMPDNRTLALVDLRSGVPNLWSLPLFGGKQMQVTHFPSGVIWNCAYSADGKSIALARGSRQSDAVLFTSAN